MIELQKIRIGDIVSSVISHLYYDFYTPDNFKNLEENSQKLKESDYNYFLNLFSKISDQCYIEYIIQILHYVKIIVN